jgi:hypothetical protein
MTGIALMALGAVGVIWFAFLSWRALGGSTARVDSHDLAARAPKGYRLAGRVSGLVFVVGAIWFFRT